MDWFHSKVTGTKASNFVRIAHEVREANDRYLEMSNPCCTFTCSLCASKFHGRRHFHPEGWGEAMQSFFREQVPGLTSVCVCKACESNIRRCLKKRNDGEPYAFRWLKKQKKCCIPFCDSVDIKASKHAFSREEICSYVGVGSIASHMGAELFLCEQHYQLVYRMKNARESACSICGVKRTHAKESARRFLSCPDPKKVESYLKDTTGVGICLRDGDLICYSCCSPMFACYQVET